MAGTFDSVATLLTDLVNAGLSVWGTVLTGDNAGIIITGVVVLVVILVILKVPQKYLGVKI